MQREGGKEGSFCGLLASMEKRDFLIASVGMDRDSLSEIPVFWTIRYSFAKITTLVIETVRLQGKCMQ